METIRETARFATVDDVRRLVEGFEACTIPPQEWDHAAHLVMALWYTLHLPEAAALEAIRAGIQRFNASHGGTGYHETLTRFWAGVVRRFVDAAGRDRPLPELAAELLEHGADRHLALSYYSHERLFSPEARARWVEPDLQPADGGKF